MIKVYAHSLFDLAKEENLLDVFYNEFITIDKLYIDEEIKNFFENRFVGIKYKKELVSKYFKQSNNYFKNFLLILSENNHFQYLQEISHEYVNMYLKEKNIEKGIIYAVDIDKEELEKIEKAFSKKINKKVELTFIKDESLIAGYRIKINSKLYDTSYKSKLEGLKKSLKKEA